ncbi:hydroxyethylthiazole kinase [Cellulomonas cellasea]|uniref:Hydroxyethylthiazole kinase n=1 Tax=Cellulomonas cellasea TaxID=43670 RepID=A0A7W4YE23_9CELL|nr:hydroxyethylthiazole kinase [Cellulomonas cellasea]MBB2925166.1 hydroxyethylthiazole kinase [Cellulomonas cellasea]
MTHAPETDQPGSAAERDALLGAVHEAATQVRERTPLVQCLTNEVTVNLVANVLLAAGASPAMVATPGEAEELAHVADAVLVNLGTMGADHRASIRSTVAAAQGARTPWVLDPVAVGVLSLRTRLAAEILVHTPAVVRGNASEVRALAGLASAGRGVDAHDDVDDALTAAVAVAERTGAVVAVSGATDLVTDGVTVVRLTGGDPLLTLMTGGGCALGGLVAATSAVASPLVAAVTASAWFNAAATDAARVARGPGSFAVAFVDALHALAPDDLVERAAAGLQVGALTAAGARA